MGRDDSAKGRLKIPSILNSHCPMRIATNSILYLIGATPNAKNVDLVAFVFSCVFRIQLLKIPPIRFSKKLSVIKKFAFMSVELFLLCKSHFLQK